MKKSDPYRRYFSKDRLGKIFIIFWVPLMVMLIGIQMAKHLVSMPLPDDYQKIQATLPKLRHSDHWLLVHVIYENCNCTNALTTSLLERGVQPDAEEWVLYVDAGAGTQEQFEAKGFSFLSKTSAEMEHQYGIEAAPMLLIFSPEDRLVYGGGYFERPSVFRSQDTRVLGRLKENKSVEALPVYGCAVSPRLQELSAPFGLKL